MSGYTGRCRPSESSKPVQTTTSTKAPRKRGPAAGADANHPKYTDPKWSTYTAGEKIQKGLAYKRENA